MYYYFKFAENIKLALTKHVLKVWSFSKIEIENFLTYI